MGGSSSKPVESRPVNNSNNTSKNLMRPDNNIGTFPPPKSAPAPAKTSNISYGSNTHESKSLIGKNLYQDTTQATELFHTKFPQNKFSSGGR